MKIDLSETSVIIHFRKDSEDRLFNLKTILTYFDTFFNVGELIVINDDACVDPCIVNLKKEFPNFIYKFFRNDGIYKRCLCFNKMAKIAKCPIVMFYDTDVLVKPEFLKISEDLILTGRVDHIYPYNGLFVNIWKPAFEHFLPNFNFKYLENCLKDRTLGYNNEFVEVIHDKSVGGLLMFSNEKFEKIGGYNENFLGWGGEDVDICNRSYKVNRVLKIPDIDAICWHLHHNNTVRTENPHYKDNLKIMFGVK